MNEQNLYKSNLVKDIVERIYQLWPIEVKKMMNEFVYKNKKQEEFKN